VELHLDTSTGKKAKASLIENGKVFDSITTESPLKSIDKLLKKHKLKLEDIEEIDYNQGPGSFTGLRVGAAVVNTLNFALGRKVKLKELKYE
jgi:tRNA threonylcarbamoyladenosine biosynthesis protein TsaB